MSNSSSLLSKPLEKRFSRELKVAHMMGERGAIDGGKPPDVEVCGAKRNRKAIKR